MPAKSNGVDVSAHLVQSLDRRWERFTKELVKCQRSFSEKTVHDLRVATRRLISTLDILRSVMPEGILRKPRRQLRRNLRAFSLLRDTQVQILATGGMVEEYPELKPFLTMLKVREQRQVSRLNRVVRQIKPAALRRSIATIRRCVQTMFNEPVMQDPLKAAVIGAAAAAFVRVVDLRTKALDGDPPSIHNMRVAFKKFRYTMEAAQPLLHGVTDEVLKAMNDFQQRMGDIQDIEVLRDNVNAFASRWRRTSRTSMQRAQRELTRRRKAAIDLFLRTSGDLFQFWNPPESTKMAQINSLE
jgi:CHAD domain-containing protein